MKSEEWAKSLFKPCIHPVNPTPSPLVAWTMPSRPPHTTAASDSDAPTPAPLRMRCYVRCTQTYILLRQRTDLKNQVLSPQPTSHSNSISLSSVRTKQSARLTLISHPYYSPYPPHFSVLPIFVFSKTEIEKRRSDILVAKNNTVSEKTVRSEIKICREEMRWKMR